MPAFQLGQPGFQMKDLKAISQQIPIEGHGLHGRRLQQEPDIRPVLLRPAGIIDEWDPECDSALPGPHCSRNDAN